ncbi:hypothetical protein PVAP13_3KG411701 [Panicum virgatum]|uniref:Uncharacterized protein n=1 Tax=Panicum virgatum TaxID=38727 RepID=A0A8T0V401_PANVG|nr:hypothetical protein PVAP13_3KG411701 [Panicum virgatum]
MVSFPPRRHQMYHHLLELAAIVTALLMLFCLQLSAVEIGGNPETLIKSLQFLILQAGGPDQFLASDMETVVDGAIDTGVYLSYQSIVHFS